MRPAKTPLDPTLPMWAQTMSSPYERAYREAQMRLGQLRRYRDIDRTSEYNAICRYYLKATSDALNRWRESSGIPV